MTRTLLAVVAAGALLLAATTTTFAAVPGVVPTGAGRSLTATETATLGPEHAAAHARQRLLAAEAAATAPAPAAAERPAASPATSAAAAAAPEPAPDAGGRWGPAIRLPVIAIHSALLPTGKVLMFAYPARPGYAGYDNRADAFLWDPVSATSKRVDPPIDPATGKPTNIWCAGMSLLADGRLLVAGGNVGDPLTDFHGITAVFTFNPFTETWDPPHTPMAQGRWYPSQLLMADGRTLIVSGLTRPGDRDYPPGGPRVNTDVEVFSPDGSLRLLTDLRLGTAGRPPLPGLYPHMFWMPSGRALLAGPERTDSWFLDAPVAGAASRWSNAPDLSVKREWGNAVLLEGGRVLTLGGSAADSDADGRRPPTATAETFDEARPGDGWRAAPPMAVARSHANSVLLPDATIATIGGGLGEGVDPKYYRWLFTDDQRSVELRDPETGAVVRGAAQSEGRTYHSTALLLPDARVLSAGDDINGPGGPGTGVDSDTAEIYSPPYLFRGPRPQLDQAPATMPVGLTFDVCTSGPAAVRAVLVAPGAVTHSSNTSQRVITLASRPAGGDGRLQLTLPADPDVLLPGHYMLFLLSADGVPSVARFIRVEPAGASPPGALPACAPPIAPVAAPAEPVTPPPPPPPPAPVALTLSARLPSMRVVRRTRRFTVTVGVSEAAKVSLTAKLERGRLSAVAIASTRTTRFKAAGRRRVTFKLTSRGRRLLAVRRRGVLRIAARAVSDSGRPVPAAQARRQLR